MQQAELDQLHTDYLQMLKYSPVSEEIYSHFSSPPNLNEIARLREQSH